MTAVASASIARRWIDTLQCRCLILWKDDISGDIAATRPDYPPNGTPKTSA